MKTKIEDYNTIAKQLKKDYSNLTGFEVLTLAILIGRNQILENGLVVSSSDKNPSGLEAIKKERLFKNKLRTNSFGLNNN